VVGEDVTGDRFSVLKLDCQEKGTSLVLSDWEIGKYYALIKGGSHG